MSEPNAQDASAAEFEEFKAWKAAQAAANEPAKPVEYYVHLANGDVVTLDQEAVDQAGSHYDGIEVIAKYQVGA